MVLHKGGAHADLLGSLTGKNQSNTHAIALRINFGFANSSLLREILQTIQQRFFAL